MLDADANNLAVNAPRDAVAAMPLEWVDHRQLVRAGKVDL